MAGLPNSRVFACSSIRSLDLDRPPRASATPNPSVKAPFKLSSNHGIFVEILDLISRPVFHFLTDAAEAPRRMNREITRGADVEMLVKPTIWRHEQTRLVPRNDDFVAAFRPSCPSSGLAAERFPVAFRSHQSIKIAWQLAKALPSVKRHHWPSLRPARIARRRRFPPRRVFALLSRLRQSARGCR
jgi:hypothetical protein